MGQFHGEMWVRHLDMVVVHCQVKSVEGLAWPVDPWNMHQAVEPISAWKSRESVREGVVLVQHSEILWRM